jgi:hypothetical protein
LVQICSKFGRTDRRPARDCGARPAAGRASDGRDEAPRRLAARPDCGRGRRPDCGRGRRPDCGRGHRLDCGWRGRAAGGAVRRRDQMTGGAVGQRAVRAGSRLRGRERAARAARVSAGGNAFCPARTVQAVEDREGKRIFLPDTFLQFVFSVYVPWSIFLTCK